MQHVQWLLLTVVPWYSKVSWDACSLISHLHMLSILIKNFHETLHKKFFNITWQNNFFLSWIDWSQTFDFRMFWKNINCFWFWWKTYTKCCTSNYVITCVKRLSSPVLCLWSGALSFRVWFGKRNIAVKILILILFRFCLLCWLRKHLFGILSLL